MWKSSSKQQVTDTVVNEGCVVFILQSKEVMCGTVDSAQNFDNLCGIS
jgi:hypothetical protein